eukprot:g934.t1
MIAWLLLPNVIHPLWGKFVFCLMDLVCAVFIESIIAANYPIKDRNSVFAVCVWLFNPFTFAISTRGSCDSITAALVLALNWFLVKERFFYSGIVWGLSIHWRLYPVIYFPALLCFLVHQSGHKGHLRQRIRSLFSVKNISFGMGALLSLGSFGVLFYALYGDEYLKHSLFYHMSRLDPRHNFSFHFYPIYLLNWKSPYPSHLWWLDIIDLGRIGSLTQIFLMSLIGFKFRKDLSLSLTLTTIVFVAFNKVCTAQYFVWYFCLLPLLTPRECFRHLSIYKAIAIWIISQVNWLFWAYLLEFQGVSCYLQVWFSSCLFLLANINLLIKLAITASV